MSDKKTNSKQEKPWNGRFTEPTDVFVEAFTASIEFDKRLYHYDIQGSIAHAKMLHHVKVLNATELEQIISGLTQIEKKIENDEFNWQISLEDVHMNIESALTQLIGVTGKKLHTGRSRNDQVATDIRLYLRAEIQLILAELQRLQVSLIDLAEQHYDTIMPRFYPFTNSSADYIWASYVGLV